MKKLLFLILVPALSLAQVGINTKTPTETFDVNGTVRIRVMPAGAVTDSIVVTRNGVLRKIAVSDILSGNTGGKCPRLNRTSSSEYYLLFDSDSSVPLPTAGLTIENRYFSYSGSYVQSNIYYYSWSNTTGNPLNINQNFTVNFNGLICKY